MTLGSSKDILFEGGPKPWVLEPLKFFRNLSTADAEGTGLFHLDPPSSRNHFQHWTRAVCRDLGEQVRVAPYIFSHVDLFLFEMFYNRTGI